jgi:hypothetical protein
MFLAYCKNPVDGTWWSFDDTRVTKLSSPSEIKTASAYILFYSKRSTFPGASNQPVVPFQVPTQQQQPQHWCRSLIKKYHKIPTSLSNSNYTIGDSLNGTNAKDASSPDGNCEETSDSTISAQDSSSKPLTNGDSSPPSAHDGSQSSTYSSGKTKSTSDNNKGPTLTNGYHHPNTTNSSTVSSSNSSMRTTVSGSGSSGAPLARMEDVGIGLAMGYDTKELQIVSTV